MGCNCGKTGKPNVAAGGSSAKGKYSLTQSDGTRTFYETETAARAANSKLGGKGLVRRVS